ncbi:MAG: HNH endonuclease [Tildeniella nuda ZEHNDER 1965/U140]|jgi:5-methylcytosine-specific restriction endonuclease McrA|nr:HNH endonuclease [Tildeniella nuda ZEHNDER 1965/U140]
MTDFDTAKFFVGDLCPHNHFWQGEPRSLRYTKDRGCVECKKAYHQRNKERILAKKSEYHRENIDSRKAYNKQYIDKNLERIKAQQKEYRLANKDKITARSIEYRRKNRERKLEYMRRYYALNKDRINEYSRAYHHRNADRNNAYKKAWHRANRQHVLDQKKLDRKLNPQKYKEKDRERYSKHRETCLARNKAYRQTERGRLVRRQLERKREAVKKGNHSAKYIPEQLLSLRQEFGNLCAYCQSGGAKTMDHFIPVSKGGSDVLSNLLPCCWSCNSSKQDKDPKEWYFSQSFSQKKRWAKILKVLGKTDSNYLVLPLL